MSKENLLRAIFDFKLKSKKIIYNGFEIEVREPTLFQKNEHVFKSLRDDQATIDNAKYMVYSAIDLTYFANTEEKVFDETHFESLLNLPEKSILSDIAVAIIELNSDATMDKKNS